MRPSGWLRFVNAEKRLDEEEALQRCLRRGTPFQPELFARIDEAEAAQNGVPLNRNHTFDIMYDLLGEVLRWHP